MSQFEEFLKEVLRGAEALAKKSLQDVLKQAKDDAQGYLDQTRSDLERWTKALSSHQMQKTEFIDLVHGRASLAEMHALTIAGVALTRVQRFRDGLTQIVLDSAFKTFL